MKNTQEDRRSGRERRCGLQQERTLTNVMLIATGAVLTMLASIILQPQKSNDLYRTENTQTTQTTQTGE